MKRISKAMVERGGWRYCCVCRQLGPRAKAHWQHEGREYCDAHKPAPELELGIAGWPNDRGIVFAGPDAEKWKAIHDGINGKQT